MTAVACIVVNFGSSALLETNLAPLTRSMPGLVTVVVDNWTTAAERRDLIDLADREGWLTVLPDTNTGFGGGMNLGAAAAIGAGAERLLLLNPDAVIDSEAVVTLARASAAAKDALLAPRILRPDGSVWFAGSDLYLDDGRIRSLRRRLPGARVEPWLSGACLMLSAELWTKAGGFDESYFLYWEDVDLCRRIREVGGSLLVVDDATAVHAQGGTQGAAGASSAGEAKSTAYYYYNIRNRLLFATRHLTTPDLLLWRRASVPIMWEVLLQGGRRQFLRKPSTILTGLRGLRDGRRLVRAELARRSNGRPSR